MQSGEKYKLLKIYISEDSVYKGHNLYNAVIYKLRELGIAGATVTRSIEGYGRGRSIHATRILELSSSLPVIIEAVDTAEMIAKVIPVIKEMVNEGFILTTDVDVIK